jgi:tetratricopeptide (TPR) repeat protein
LEGYRSSAEVALEVIDGLETSPEQRETLMFGLLVYMTLWLRDAEVRYGAASVNPPKCLLPEFSNTTMPLAVRGLPEPLRSWCEEGHDRVHRQTGERALLLGDHGQAIAAFRALTRRRPTAPLEWTRLAAALRGAGRQEEADEAERQAGQLHEEGVVKGEAPTSTDNDR